MNLLGRARATTFDGMLAFSVRMFTNVVGTETPSTRTTESLMNPTPSTVTSKAGLPSATALGVIPLISGSGVQGIARIGPWGFV